MIEWLESKYPEGGTLKNVSYNDKIRMLPKSIQTSDH